MIMENFQVKIESELQWERWEIELNSHLKMIIGANNVAFSYVIREYTIPDHIKQATWEEKYRLAAPHTWYRYMIYKLLVHNIVTCNVSKTSHA